MPSVFTIEGARMRKKRKKGRRLGQGEACKMVPTGKKGSGCKIMLCKTGRRWKFQKGTRRCSR